MKKNNIEIRNSNANINIIDYETNDNIKERRGII